MMFVISYQWEMCKSPLDYLPTYAIIKLIVKTASSRALEEGVAIQGQSMVLDCLVAYATPNDNNALNFLNFIKSTSMFILPFVFNNHCYYGASLNSNPIAPCKIIIFRSSRQENTLFFFEKQEFSSPRMTRNRNKKRCHPLKKCFVFCRKH